MAEFRTKLPLIELPLKINHKTSILCIGSCFAEHMSLKLASSKIPVMLNPFGILYNPHSIARSLEYLVQETTFAEQDLFEANGLWHSFAHHGNFSKSTPKDTLLTINEKLKKGIDFLKKTKILVVTLGSSNVFVYKKTGEVVANCHKLPNSEFERISLSVDDVFRALNQVFRQLKASNPQLQILLTVSPVRHIRDGLIENQKSKARLLVACDYFTKAQPYVHYFPAYELIMDDLRDYRFFHADMIHPNEVAIEYIWNYFSQCFFETETLDLVAKIKKIRQATQHQPFHTQSVQHQAFLKKQLQTIAQLEKEYDALDFTEERQVFLQQMH